MAKVNIKNIRSRYTLRGFMLGIIIYLLTIISSTSIFEHVNQPVTFYNLYRFFPGLWFITFLPFITAFAGYIISGNFAFFIRKQRKHIKQEASKSETVLEFVENLRQDNFESDLNLNQRKDKLAQSLLRLRDYLIKSKKDEEQRRIEEEQRTWVTQGLAHFGELLRKENDNIEDLSYNIIRYLVDYMKVNQAGFYLLNTINNTDRYFELTACVAYDRKKFTDKRINWEEGLVGRCALEKQTIHLTDIPNDYLNITSGLGEANPRSILIVPLKTNDEIYGVLEMASFKEFPEFEVEFVEKIAESIALTISSVQNTIRTTKLLKETQNQAERMLQQEEELRQNLEEMQATQEESDRREVEMKGILEAIEHAAISAEFETDGTLINVNQNFLRTFRYNPEEIEGQNIKIFTFKDDVDEMEQILTDLRNGHNFKGRVRRRTKMGDEVYLLTTYTPVIDHEGEIIKILSLENDVTEQVKMEEEMKHSKDELGVLLEEAKQEITEQFKEVEAVKIRNEKTLEGALDAILTTNQEGIVEFFNVAAEKLWGYERSEVLGQHVSMLFAEGTIANDEFISAFVSNDKAKISGERREAPIKNKVGNEEFVLFLLSEAEVGGDHSYTAFIQQVEVELF
ncbi:PAS domain S-box protein [Carboxylicivirga sp. M1479]|uniref:PAS domain S-box protein n=1 Tax=Carboxylicivirga sp. M1479 TaxID=2594476 RepID=UPI001177D658|nr:PAS domain S-box protein [Carboxylicivirga sp. M1479]TRX71610.1 PAS domain S-box protein [Carboxylicivirga sp. M1479]